MNRNENMEKLLDELALVVDGDREAMERHADFLADDDEARDLKHDAMETAERLAEAGADYVPPADLEARLMAALDARAAGTVPAVEGTTRKTDPGFVLDPHAQAEIAKVEARMNEPAPIAERAVAPTVAMREVVEPAPREEAKKVEPARGNGLAKVIVLFGALGVAAAAAAALVVIGASMLGGGEEVAEGETETPVVIAQGATTGRVVEIARSSSDGASGVQVRAAGGAWQPATQGAEIAAGAAIRTDERTRARITLSDGSEMVLNHSTEVRFDPQQARRFELPAGEVLAEIAHLENGPNLGITVPTGRVEVLGTKFVLAATPESASVRVTRGTVRVHGANQGSREVKSGEEGVLRANAAPEVAPVMDLARSLSWSELNNVVAQDDPETTLPGIGSLRARRPGEREDRERPLTLARHDVRVRIVGNVARTEIEEVFRNDSDATLEGIYRFPLPADAQIARLALDVNGVMEEGAFVARERAQRIWRGVIRNATPVAERRPTEEFIWVPGPWRDPALLEWQRGGQFELRIFPIPAHGERRVVIAYTQTIAPTAEGRRYVYPLAHSRDESLRVGEFNVDVRVANAQRVNASGYQVRSAADADATRLSYQQTGFLPNGDLVIDYAIPGGERELAFWTYQGDAAQAPPAQSRDQDREVIDLQRQIAADSRPYVAFALRPELPARTEGAARDYVIVVDSSQSMVGERFQRASRLVSGVIAEMDRRDRFTVLACDYECRSMEGTAENARMRVPSAGEMSQVSQWLSRVEPAGASDLIATMRTASRAGSAQRETSRRVHVIYVGDGVASAGHRSTAALSSEAERLATSAHVAFTTVGIGGDADATSLAAIARSGGGHYVPFVPGQRASLAALSVLETTYGVALRDARLELPSGLVEVAPERLPTIRAGEEVIVTARMSSASELSGDVVLRGTVGGEPFEQRYPVRLVPSTAAGNRFVPALWAAHRIEQIEAAGRGEDEARIVAMSKAYSVMSRHTSLLVLESEAMFRAFGIDRAEAPVAQWTGEDDVEGGTAIGALALPPSEMGGVGDVLAGGAVTSSASGAGRSGGGEAAAGFATSGTRAARRAPAEPTVTEAAPMAEEAEERSRGRAADSSAVAQTRDDFDRAWREQQQQAPQRPPAAAAPTPTVPAMRPRGPGQWMRRVYYRVGEIQEDGAPSFREQEQARLAEESLRMQPDSRDRHRAAVRALSRAGNLERALEVAEAWFSRDRLDPEALVARADVLARLGRRDEALRLLTGVVDVRPDDAALHTRLAGAFERAGDEARACAHRISLAEIRNEDAEIVADAVRCERMASHRELAQLLLDGVREDRARTRAATLAEQADDARRSRGEITVEASWPGGDDVDVALIAPDGSRLSWMGGRTTIVGEDARRDGRETIGLSRATVGNYLVEVARTSPEQRGAIRGTLRIRALDGTRTVPFVIDDGERESVARIVVRRESRMEAVGAGW
ncbi:FecR domain-containing protein [Sandaracinus amylolyticus]|uniref:Uncharacterized protein n=1 Tax=Sandaracinus amylolyticus TaxID=927083 RepID=A0A0F6W939_9BACT|nr:FecR domain-containing protein [Sandaracinus amylolyticus]AKF10536.1 hypothetical protein DB32_007685 [Sandaracinus amylolyticus]